MSPTAKAIGIVVLIVLLIAAPAFLADLIMGIANGIGVLFGRFTSS